MRVVIDECIDERFRNSLPEHDCQTVRYAGLAGLKNGELLTTRRPSKSGQVVAAEFPLELHEGMGPILLCYGLGLPSGRQKKSVLTIFT